MINKLLNFIKLSFYRSRFNFSLILCSLINGFTFKKRSFNQLKKNGYLIFENFLNHSECDLLRKTQEPQQKTLIHNVMLDKNSIVSTSNKNNSINDIIKYNESNNLADLTEQLNNNPYAISIV